MKITYVVHQFLPRYFSGTEQFVFALACEMRRRGHVVEVFTLEPEFERENPALEMREEEVDGLKVMRLAYWRQIYPNPVRLEYHHPQVGWSFGRYLDERRPDLVHVFHLRYLGGNLMMELERRAIPSVVHLMDFWFLCPVFLLLRADGSLCDGPPEGGMGCFACVNEDLDLSLRNLGLQGPVGRLHRRAGRMRRAGHGLYSLYSALLERQSYLREALARADRIIAPSFFLREIFARNGIDEKSIEVLTYGLDRRRLESLTPVRERDRAGEGLVFGYIGTISHFKGVHVFIDAIRRTPGALRALVYGRLEDYEDYSRTLVERAREDERIEFRGAFEVSKLGEVLGGLDALVVPSLWYENTPFVILEAFAAGIPVLATNLGGMSELVRDGENGELFERANVEDLARRLGRLLREPETLAGYRRNIEAVKTLEDNADEIENVYRIIAPEVSSDS